MATMSKEARDARAAYQRAWRRANPEKVAAIKARYWNKKAKVAMEAAEQEAEYGQNANH